MKRQSDTNKRGIMKRTMQLLLVPIFLICCVMVLNSTPMYGWIRGNSSKGLSSRTQEEGGGEVQVSVTSLYRDPSILPSDLDGRVKVLRQQTSKPLKDKRCVPLPESPRPGVKICVYSTKDDFWVSGMIAKGQLFEAPLVKQMAERLQADPSLQLIDIGANIGVYSLYAAALGHQVLAVEMLPQNAVMIQNSLAVSPPDVASKVTIVNNALYMNHTELSVTFWQSNVGGTRIIGLNVPKLTEQALESKVKVHAVCMDDLLPLVTSKKVWIKMDIEGAEAAALQCADKFFNSLDVIVLMMEWKHTDPAGPAIIIDFMTSRGFVAISASGAPLKVTNETRTVAGNTVFWRKSETSVYEVTNEKPSAI